MTDHHQEIRWVSVASYSARYLAEIPLQTLQAEGIPVLVKGEEPGIWGPAFSGPTSQGIELLVPEPAEEDAREILDSLGTADGDEWDEEWESE
ncbi:MAG TPA: hypothetical protein VLA43_19100 [Longimicrobiales bacterium]|nr:hypothetical protein [Longimicrobiales bacterium]